MAKVRGWAKCVKGVKKVQAFGYKINTPFGYNVQHVTIVNYTVLNIWKLLREWILKVFNTRKLWLVTDMNETSCGSHSTMYTNIESLLCILEMDMLIICQ